MFEVNDTTGQITIASGAHLNYDITNSYTLNIKITDGSITDTAIISINLSDGNDAPTVTSAIADQTWSGSGSKNFQFATDVFADADGDTLTYTAKQANGSALPAWLTFDSTTHTFTGNPPSGVSSLSISATADDGHGGTVGDTFVLSIANANDAPTVVNAIADQDWNGPGNISLQIPANTFTDADIGDTLAYTATLKNGKDLPSWLAFDPTTRTFTGNPPDGVSNLQLTIVADDGHGGAVSESFKLKVTDANDTPAVTNPIADQTWSGSGNLIFKVPANTFADMDGDSLTYTAELNSVSTLASAFAHNARQSSGSPLPSWLSFDPSTLTFTGNPPSGVASLSLTVIADDGHGSTVSNTFTLNIANANDAPTVANAIGNQNWSGNGNKSFQVAANTFTDADQGDSLTYSAKQGDGAALPTWLTFDPNTLRFTGNSPYGVTNLNLAVFADDGHGGTAKNSFKLNTNNPAPPPAVPVVIPTVTPSGGNSGNGNAGGGIGNQGVSNSSGLGGGLGGGNSGSLGGGNSGSLSDSLGGGSSGSLGGNLGGGNSGGLGSTLGGGNSSILSGGFSGGTLGSLGGGNLGSFGGNMGGGFSSLSGSIGGGSFGGLGGSTGGWNTGGLGGSIGVGNVSSPGGNSGGVNSGSVGGGSNSGNATSGGASTSFEGAGAGGGKSESSSQSQTSSGSGGSGQSQGGSSGQGTKGEGSPAKSDGKSQDGMKEGGPEGAKQGEGGDAKEGAKQGEGGDAKEGAKQGEGGDAKEGAKQGEGGDAKEGAKQGEGGDGKEGVKQSEGGDAKGDAKPNDGKDNAKPDKAKPNKTGASLKPSDLKRGVRVAELHLLDSSGFQTDWADLLDALKEISTKKVA
ncbi:MAG: putative Ig domain-containing protein [Magnetococcales bacterium]|nr:putative Ig domain-containing protein [Magnetococcales bacterium]